MKKIFNNASWRSMKRSVAPYIKPYIRNNNSSLVTEKLRLSTGVSFVNQKTKKRGGGYKQKSVGLVRDSLVTEMASISKENRIPKARSLG